MKASSFPRSRPEVTSVNSGDTSAVHLLSQNWEYFKMRLRFLKMSPSTGGSFCALVQTLVGLGCGSWRWLRPPRAARHACLGKKSSGDAAVSHRGSEGRCVFCAVFFLLPRHVLLENVRHLQTRGEVWSCPPLAAPRGPVLVARLQFLKAIPDIPCL